MSGSDAPEPELAGAWRVLAEREAELASVRRQNTELAAELEETSRGLTALYGELEDARLAAARLAAIAEWSGDAMLAVTADAVITAWNPGAERLLGYTAIEITGRSAFGLIPDGDEGGLTALLRWAAEGGAAEEGAAADRDAAGRETRALRKDGSGTDVAVTCSAMRGPDGAVTGYSIVLRDITARLAAEAELAAVRAERTVLAERDRMARDLHDRVIQRIFAAGMSLQAAVSLARNPAAAARMETVIRDLDTSIDELRETIYSLRHGIRPHASLHDGIIALADGATPVLGFCPEVRFTGAAAGIPLQTAEHVLAVCREALSNIARHAGATAATITLSAGGEIRLTVSDNGRGLGQATRSSGLRNMRERAELLGGTFTAASQPGGGTQLEWSVPR